MKRERTEWETAIGLLEDSDYINKMPWQAAMLFTITCPDKIPLFCALDLLPLKKKAAL